VNAGGRLITAITCACICLAVTGLIGFFSWRVVLRRASWGPIVFLVRPYPQITKGGDPDSLEYISKPEYSTQPNILASDMNIITLRNCDPIWLDFHPLLVCNIGANWERTAIRTAKIENSKVGWFLPIVSKLKLIFECQDQGLSSANILNFKLAAYVGSACRGTSSIGIENEIIEFANEQIGLFNIPRCIQARVSDTRTIFRGSSACEGSADAFPSGLNALFRSTSRLLGNSQSSTHEDRLHAHIPSLLFHGTELKNGNDGLKQGDQYQSSRKCNDPPFGRRFFTYFVTGICSLCAGWRGAGWIVSGRRFLGFSIIFVNFLLFAASGVLFFMTLFPWSWCWGW
jgi:hypothetical protein